MQITEGSYVAACLQHPCLQEAKVNRLWWCTNFPVMETIFDSTLLLQSAAHALHVPLFFFLCSSIAALSFKHCAVALFMQTEHSQYGGSEETDT